MTDADWPRVGTVTATLLALSLISFLLLDCTTGHTEVYHCPVVGHGHRPAYTTTSMECMIHNAKDGSCSVWIPVEHHHPERWWLVYRHANEAGGGEGAFDVGLARWQETSEGATVRVRYVVGRYTRHYYGLGLVSDTH